MLRKLILALSITILLCAVDANNGAAQVNRGGLGRGSRANQQNAQHRRLRRGLLHIQVRTPEGRPSDGATVRIAARGKRGIVRRTNRRGVVNIAVPPGNHLIRARGPGGNRGSASVSAAAGAISGVTVQLHGHAKRPPHPHEAHGLGLLHPHRNAHNSTGTSGTPGASGPTGTGTNSNPANANP